MIISFKDKEAEKLFNGKFSARLPQEIQRTAAMKLAMLNAATMLETLRVPPSNNLEPLRGDRQGQQRTTQYQDQPTMAYLLQMG